MRLDEKLKQLMKGRKQSTICEEANIGRTALSGYINKSAMPPADAALRLARALEVPLEWLVDDDQGWPPPASDDITLQAVSDHDLMIEMAGRYRRLAEDVIKTTRSVMRDEEWASTARQVLAVPLDQPIPPDLHDAYAKATTFLSLMSRINSLMPDQVAIHNYGDWSDPLKANELMRKEVESLHDHARENLCVPVQALIEYDMLRNTANSLKKRRNEWEFYREKLADQFDQNATSIDMDAIMDSWKGDAGGSTEPIPFRSAASKAKPMKASPKKKPKS